MMTGRKILVTVCLLCYSLIGHAQFSTWIVDNNLTKPTGSHIFADLPAAIAAANAGDVIYVKASPNLYSNAKIDKELTIVGDGFKGTTSTINTLTINMDGSSSSVYGMNISNQLTIDGGDGVSLDLMDLDIAYNFIETVTWNSGGSTDTLRNTSFRSNIIGSGETSSGVVSLYLVNRTSNITISNNVFYGTTAATQAGSVRATGAYMYGNAFIGSGTQKSFDLIVNCSVYNNVFYGRSAEAFNGSSSNNDFYGNIIFGTTDDIFANVLGVIGNDSGSNQNADPEFTNITLSTAWDFDLFTMQYEGTSPALAIGSGPSETAFSETGRWLPQIESLNGAHEILQGNNLIVNVEAFIDDGLHDVPSLSEFEYFISGDPGFGLATSPATTPSGPTFSGQLTLTATSSLSPGTYNIFLRTRDEQRWGLYESYPIVVLDNAASGSDVAALEYFFDEDPGYGMGTSIPVTQSPSIDQMNTIDASALPLGFHSFYVRAQDQYGNWSMSRSSLVYVDQSGTAGTTVVNAIEYFFDEDPGYGLATPLTVSTPSNMIDVAHTVSTSGLSLGFHNLFIRVQDDGGTWGLPISKLLYIDQSGAEVVDNITAIEYFFDEDPGYGLGSNIPVPTPDDTLEIVDIISTSGLALGFHNLFLRVQDAGGSWSLPVSKLVYIDQSGTELVSNIEAIEYFFDEDPGYGSGLSIPVPTPDDTLEITDAITTSGLALGFHNLFIRVKDAGGTWSIPVSKLVYIDQAGGATVAPIDLVEYFFDEDPGYGAGTQVSTGAAVQIDSLISASSSSLSLGFHNLYVRVRDINGRWGLAESSLVYVDPQGNVSSHIAELEYFFDDDPGFGQALSIPIDPAEPNPLRKLILSAGELPGGEHVLGVRARNEADVWGVTSHSHFISFPPSRELDSVSLLLFYDKTGGADWLQNFGWGELSMDSWYGITLTNNRVDSIKMEGNNLAGILPEAMGYIDQATYISLAENVLRDTIPETFSDLNQLVTLRLHDNEFNEIPNLSGISGLQNVSLDSNYFDFGDLEPLASVSNFTYSNQQVFNDFAVDTTAVLDQPLTIDKLIEGVNSSYQWYRNEEAIEFGDLEDFEILELTSEDTGSYVLRVNNSVITGLQLETAPYHIFISDFDEDSLAMVSMYNSLSGSQWTGAANWLNTPINSWEGVSLAGNRVTTLNLSGKNLSGKIPADLSYADALESLNLSQNQITDTVPQTFQRLKALATLNLAGNAITSIPALNSVTSLTTFNVSQNRLQFGDLEKNIGVDGFTYANQDSIGIAQDTVIDVNSNLLIGHQVSGSNNQYQWLLDGTPVSSEQSDEINVQNIQFGNEGKYILRVTNSLVPGLTLNSRPFELLVSSLRRDSLALLAIYESTEGGNWSPPVNWASASLSSNNWDGVQVQNSRVTSIDLSSRNLTGTIPVRIRDITGVGSVDLADNQIAALPNLSQMPQLSSLKLDSNKLFFKYLIPNRGVTGVSYANQKRFGTTLYDTLDAGDNVTLNDFESLDFGNGSFYQWNFGPLQPGKPFNDDVQPIDDAEGKAYTIENVNINSQGTYRLTVEHPLIPGLTLQSRNRNVMARTDFVGQVNLNGTPVTDAEVVVWRKTPSGPFVKEDSTTVDGSGNYLLEDVVLGTFIVLARPNIDLPAYKNTVQTYYFSADTYSEADELLLDGNTTGGVNISLIDYTPTVTGNAVIRGTVESDFVDQTFVEGDVRVSSRRKVRKAGCSMRRFKSTGRDLQDVEEEIAYYIETDDEGYFNFEGVEEGKYLLNIEFPGVPMDNSTEVEFEIGGNKENQIIDVNVLITEAGIEVDQTEILYTLKPFLKDVVLYPNPTDGHFAVDYTVYRSIDDLQIRLVSNDGRILIKQQADHVKGRQRLDLDMTDLSAGTYHLLFSDRDKTFGYQLKVIRK